MALIHLEDVSKVYHMGDTQVKALDRIDLTIHEGEFVAVWGPSGSGKSTLCNLIGLLDMPSAGNIFLNDESVLTMTDDMLSYLRGEVMGFIFQGFNLLPVLSALENVMFPVEIKGEKVKTARKKAHGLLQEMGLAQFSSHRPHKLSGGQQQRVAIARALICEPNLVIADEPTANLDSKTAKNIIQLMRNINEKTGTTFLFSTHDQRLLEQVDRKILLQDGHIVHEDLMNKTRRFGNN